VRSYHLSFGCGGYIYIISIVVVAVKRESHLTIAEGAETNNKIKQLGAITTNTTIIKEQITLGTSKLLELTETVKKQQQQRMY
jgi:hypothetical protein